MNSTGIFWDLFGSDFGVIVNEQNVVNITGVEDNIFTLNIIFNHYVLKILKKVFCS